MGRVIRTNCGQLLVLPPSVEDWIALDPPARFIRDFVDAQDLGVPGFVVPEGREGRPPYGADLLLKVWLYGYFRKIRSTQGLERGCYGPDARSDEQRGASAQANTGAAAQGDCRTPLTTTFSGALNVFGQTDVSRFRDGF